MFFGLFSPYKLHNKIERRLLKEKGTKRTVENVAVVKDGVQMVTTSLSSGRYEPIIVHNTKT